MFSTQWKKGKFLEWDASEWEMITRVFFNQCLLIFIHEEEKWQAQKPPASFHSSLLDLQVWPKKTDIHHSVRTIAEIEYITGAWKRQNNGYVGIRWKHWGETQSDINMLWKMSNIWCKISYPLIFSFTMHMCYSLYNLGPNSHISPGLMASLGY